MSNNQSKTNQKTYIFKVVIEADPFEDGRRAYHAYCPALQGTSTWGYTQEEALNNIREVIVMTLESMKEKGEEVPEQPEVQVFKEPRVAVTI